MLILRERFWLGRVLQGTNFAIKPFAECFAGPRYVVLRLKPDPEIGAVAEKPAQTQRGIGRDRAPLIDDIRDSANRNADRLGERLQSQFPRFKLVTKRTAWMDGEHGTHPL